VRIPARLISAARRRRLVQRPAWIERGGKSSSAMREICSFAQVCSFAQARRAEELTARSARVGDGDAYDSAASACDRDACIGVTHANASAPRRRRIREPRESDADASVAQGEVYRLRTVQAVASVERRARTSNASHAMRNHPRVVRSSWTRSGLLSFESQAHGARAGRRARAQAQAQAQAQADFVSRAMASLPACSNASRPGRFAVGRMPTEP
jgi:hypothetical protein